MTFAPKPPKRTPGTAGATGRSGRVLRRYAETDELTSAVGVDDPTRPLSALPQRVPDLVAQDRLVPGLTSADMTSPVWYDDFRDDGAPTPPGPIDYSGLFLDEDARQRPEADPERSRLCLLYTSPSPRDS